MKKKILTAITLVIIASAVGTWYYVFVYSNTHHRDVTNEEGIAVTAKDLVKEFQTNETAANNKYLNKAVEVIGEVSETKTDQAGNITIVLKSDDAFSNVFCTLKSGNPQPKQGAKVAVKGICNGFLSDVVLNEAIVKNNF